MKILTVDDSRIVRKLVSSAIAAAGHEAVQAANGQLALDALEADPEIALVVLDWNMPVMDGLTCLKKIRANRTTENMPVMMLTTESERERMITAVKAGATNYLTKPFRPEELAIKIHECMGDA